MTARSFLKASLVGLLSVLLLWPLASAGAEISRAQMLAISCAGCHGPGGHSPGAIPSIAGRPAETIEQALKEFRSGARAATVMNRHAKGYSDEEIRLIADYFANQ